MPLFSDLLDLGLINLHSLQFGQDSEELKPWLGLDGIKDWNNELKDFSDTAYLVSQMDLGHFRRYCSCSSCWCSQSSYLVAAPKMLISVG